jgi:hypothetical protein
MDFHKKTSSKRYEYKKNLSAPTESICESILRLNNIYFGNETIEEKAIKSS